MKTLFEWYFCGDNEIVKALDTWLPSGVVRVNDDQVQCVFVSFMIPRERIELCIHYPEMKAIIWPSRSCENIDLDKVCDIKTRLLNSLNRLAEIENDHGTIKMTVK